ncbi:MAG: MFS transporter [Acidimicrobiia bacterium]|nr:MFS transporter [Acidimicrobiia bacterium]
MQRWRPIAPYFAAFLGLGVALSFFGPALPELRRQTGSSVAQMGWVFSAQSVGGLVGSLIAGRLYRHVGGRHLIALAVFGFALAIAVVPASSELIVIVAAGAVIGFGAGSLDVGGNTLVSSVVDPDRLVSSINALHMSFAVGAVLAPLVVGVSLAVSDSLWPAGAAFSGAALALAAVLWSGDRAGSARQAARDHAEQGAGPDRWRLGLVAWFFLLYVGIEIGFSGWIATYSHEVGLGSGWGTGLTVAFWAGFLAGRVLMVWRGDRIATGAVLGWSAIISTVVAVVIALVGARPIPLTLGAALFGVVIAPQFPTMLAHLHRAIPLTGVVTAWCMAGSALGGLVLPPLIGALLESTGASALPWTIGAASAASGLAIVAVNRWALALPAVEQARNLSPGSAHAPRP